MMVLKDDWVKTAMADERVVAELLIRLKQAHAVAPVKPALFPPTKWGVRQSRSRMAMRFDSATPQKDAADSMRHSPTTPLSWSAGAGSPSCTADGFEDSSFLCAVTARSKGIGNSSTEFTNSGIKRSRRKKTFAELKEEETFLLKQKMYLKKEMENMQATYKEQRAKNQSLKKMKVDIYNDDHRNGTQEEKLRDLVSPTLNRASSSADSQTVSDPCQETHHEASSCSRKKDNVLFLLPDLNMEPCEEDSPGFEVF